MKPIYWNVEKDQKLTTDSTRGFVGFDDCVAAIREGRVLDDRPNPSAGRENQRVMILNIDGYAYVVPYVESESGLFLKTMFPSRKFTGEFLKDKTDG